MSMTTTLKREEKPSEDLPEEDVRLRDGRMGREEGDDGMGVGSRDGREERGGVEGAGVEEVGGFYGIGKIRIHMSKRESRVMREGESHTSAGFEGVGTKGEDVGGEAGLEEGGLVGGYRGSGGGHGMMVVALIEYRRRCDRCQSR